MPEWCRRVRRMRALAETTPVRAPREPDPQTRIAALRCQRFADLGLHPPRLHMVRIGTDAVWHSFMPEV